MIASMALASPCPVVRMMTTASPYGPLISLDGFHPSGLGQTILADAAATAINERYLLGLRTGLAAFIP